MKSNSKLLVSGCLLLLNLLIGFCTSAQIKSAQSEPYRTISYGEKIAFGNVENAARFTISNPKENVFASVSGSQINDFVFEKPGNYEVSYSEGSKHNAEGCNHPHFPERMDVVVSAVKMTFDFSKINISDKIRLGSNDNVFIEVPVMVQTKDQKPVTFTVADAIVAGVGSQLVAKPVTPQLIIKDGTQTIRYQLTGIATKQAYIMIDFVDINGQIQSYSHPAIIN